MNILDVEVAKTPETHLYRHIRAEQEKLMLKYQEIEQMPDWPMAFDSKNGQRWFKDFAQRATEEIAEAYQSVEYASASKERDLVNKQLVHLLEEVSDAIHFMTELFIIADVPIDDSFIEDTIEQLKEKEFNDRLNRTRKYSFIGEAYRDDTPSSNPITMLSFASSSIFFDLFDVVYYVGLATNCLKMKSWKQSEVLSDKKAFTGYCLIAFTKVLTFLFHCGFDASSIYGLYNQKNQVNQFRQRSNY